MADMRELVRGRIRFFPDSPGLGGVEEAAEFVATALFGTAPMRRYRKVEVDELSRTMLCRVRRVRSSDEVDVEFRYPGAAAQLADGRFLLIQGPYPIAEVVIRDRAKDADDRGVM